MIDLCKMVLEVNFVKLIVLLNVYSTVHVSAEFENAISIVEEMLKNFDEVSQNSCYYFIKSKFVYFVIFQN